MRAAVPPENAVVPGGASCGYGVVGAHEAQIHGQDCPWHVGDCEGYAEGVHALEALHEKGISSAYSNVASAYNAQAYFQENLGIDCAGLGPCLHDSLGMQRQAWPQASDCISMPGEPLMVSGLCK